MSRITDIAIGIVLGAGGIIGAAFAWDKYENSDAANDSISTDGESDAIEDLEKDIASERLGSEGE